MKRIYFIRGRTYALLYFLLFISLSFAQKKDSLDYFPLNVGDWYQFHHSFGTYCLPAPFKDSVGILEYSHIMHVLDKYIYNSKTYYIIDTFFWSPDTVRINEDGNLVCLNWGDEIELFKFKANVNDRWIANFKTGYNKTFPITVILESASDTIEVPAGKFLKCLKFNTNVGDLKYIFSPGIGAVFICNKPAVALTKAKVGNLFYPKTNGIISSVTRINSNITVNHNYPNPFNSSTRIEYILTKRSLIKIKIMDIFGREVKKLKNAIEPAGKNFVNWDCTNYYGKIVPSGIYLFLISDEYDIHTKKIILIK